MNILIEEEVQQVNVELKEKNEITEQENRGIS